MEAGRPQSLGFFFAMNIPAEGDREASWTASLLTWGGLVGAGTLFAVATLAPRLTDLNDLHERYAVRQARLVSLEEQAETLEQVCEALRTDAHFSNELAKVELSATRPGMESIAVRPELQLRAAGSATNDATHPPYDPKSRLLRSVLAWISTHPRARTAMLAVAAAIGFVSLVGIRREQVTELARRLRCAEVTLEAFGSRYRSR
jgi:hypothetical protein